MGSFTHTQEHVRLRVMRVIQQKHVVFISFLCIILAGLLPAKLSAQLTTDKTTGDFIKNRFVQTGFNMSKNIYKGLSVSFTPEGGSQQVYMNNINDEGACQIKPKATPFTVNDANNDMIWHGEVAGMFDIDCRFEFAGLNVIHHITITNTSGIPLNDVHFIDKIKPSDLVIEHEHEHADEDGHEHGHECVHTEIQDKAIDAGNIPVGGAATLEYEIHFVQPAFVRFGEAVVQTQSEGQIFTYTLTREYRLDETVVAIVQLSDGSGTAAITAGDFEGIASLPHNYSVIFPPGVTSQKLLIWAANDDKTEANETFQLQITGISLGEQAAEPSIAKGIIVNSAAPVAALATASTSIDRKNNVIVTIASNEAPITPKVASVASTSAKEAAPASGMSYSWTVSPLSSTSGVSGQSAGSDQEVISQTLKNNTNTPVELTYTITPKYTSGDASCTGTPFKILLRVNPVPVVIPKRICE